MIKKIDSDSHIIELADGSSKRGAVEARGDAWDQIHDHKGYSKSVILKNALLIPFYKQNIFSVHSMTENGSKVFFKSNSAELQTPDGNVFEVWKSAIELKIIAFNLFIRLFF